MRGTLVVNFFAGPGAGKSTMAADVFADLKWRGVNCEMALEYAKDLVWEDRLGTLDNQVYVLGKQLHRIRRLSGQVDVILCDSPILISTFYTPPWLKGTCFNELCWELHKQTNSLNVLVEREKKYNHRGRIHSEYEARKMDERMEDVLVRELDMIVSGNRAGAKIVSEVVRDLLSRT